MFNPLNLITKFIKSSNQKELDRIGKIVEKINLVEEDFKDLNDSDFPKKTLEFKNQIKNGKSSSFKIFTSLSKEFISSTILLILSSSF